MRELKRIIITYELGGKRRRDVFEDGTKTVEQYDYTDKDGNDVWETIVAHEAKRTCITKEAVDTDT